VEVNQRVRTLLERSNVVPAGEGVIDVSAWVGQYPFRGILRCGVADWKEAAATLGISRAIVSPFEAVFWENNLDAYERWADSLAGESQLEVWPVVRPGALHGVEELLDRLHPRGLRLLPSYHDYHLYDTGVEPIMRLARERGMIVQIFTRIADERWHWMLNVPELPMHDLEYATAVFDQQPIVVCGLNRPQSLAGRMTQHPMLYADVSRLRGPVFGVEQLAKSAPADRLLFGSLWPIQIIEATLWQVTSARIDRAERDRILRDNAATLLKEEQNPH